MEEPITATALYQQVANRLRKRIYQQQLKPGERIDEKRLCEEMGISRTPLREALKVLDADGLVVLQPRRGCFVAELGEQQLKELFPVMAVLEGLIAREATRGLQQADLAELEALHEQLEQAAAREDVDRYYEHNYVFHKRVQDLSRNRYLQRVAHDLRKLLFLARHQQLKKPGRLQQSLSEHRRLMEAFRRGDADTAEATMKEHLTHQGQAVLSWLEVQRENGSVKA